MADLPPAALPAGYLYCKRDVITSRTVTAIALILAVCVLIVLR